jgi:hypothetical protein
VAPHHLLAYVDEYGHYVVEQGTPLPHRRKRPGRRRAVNVWLCLALIALIAVIAFAGGVR